MFFQFAHSHSYITQMCWGSSESQPHSSAAPWWVGMKQKICKVLYLTKVFA